MIIRKWGIELRRLTQNDIELVRQMRNKDHIRNRMFYDRYITPEEQLQWFRSINNHRNYYFLIVVQKNNEKIGLINGKNIDFVEGTLEGGLFIWNDEYWGTPYPVIASSIMHDLAFYITGIKRVLVRVRADNPLAVSYNQKLGFEIVSKNEREILMILTREKYDETSKLIKQIPPMNGETLQIDDISFEDETFEGNYTDYYLNLPLHIMEKYVRRMIQTIK